MPSKVDPRSSSLNAFWVSSFFLCTVGCGTRPQIYVERGDAFFRAGKFDDAAIQYEKALQKSPNLGQAHYQLGVIELQRNRPIQGYREFQRAVDLMPGNDEALARLGQLALSIYNVDPKHPQQLYDQAIKSAGQLVRKHPESFDANLLTGALALVDKKPSEAEVYLRRAVKAKPDDLDAKLGLARALAQENQVPEGMSLATGLIQKDKTFGPAYDFLFEQYQSSGKAADAENILKLKSSNNPKQAAYILDLARYYAVAQNPTLVASTLDRMLSNPTDFPEGRILAGDFYNSAGRPDEALHLYQDGLQTNPKNPIPYQRRIVRILGAQRKWPEALQELDVILKAKPDDQEAKLDRALVWLGEGKLENLDPAIAELRSQVAKRPQDATTHFQLGNALARKRDEEGGRREWLAASQQNREYLPPRFALVQLDLSQGKPQDAFQVAQQIIGIAPRDAQARLWYATTLMGVGQYAEARTELNRLNAQFPKSLQVRLRLGALALSERKYKEAEDIFVKLEKEGATAPQVAAGRAQVYEGENEPGKAIEFLQEELKRNPDAPILRQVLAQFAAADGKYDLAIDEYKQIASDSPQAQLSLAAVYSAKGDSKQALEILEKAVQADPKSAAASLQLARALVSVGRTNDAKARYRQVLQIQPANATALNDLAYLMAESGGNLEEALSLADRGLHNTSDPSIRKSLSDTLGWIYLKRNQYDSALQMFQVLVKSDPANATFHYHLAATLYQKGDKQKARAELQAALAAQPGSPDEPRIRELLARL